MKVTELNAQQYDFWIYPVVRLFRVETVSVPAADLNPETLVQIDVGDTHPSREGLFAKEIWKFLDVNLHNIIVAVGYSPATLIFNLPKIVPLPPSLEAEFQREWIGSFGCSPQRKASEDFERGWIPANEARALYGLPPKENDVKTEKPSTGAFVRLSTHTVDGHSAWFDLALEGEGGFKVGIGAFAHRFPYEVARQLHGLLDPLFSSPRRTPSATEPDQEKTVKMRHGMTGFVSGAEIPAWRRWMRTTFNVACILVVTGGFGALGYFTEWYVGVAPPVVAAVVVGAVKLIRHWTGFYRQTFPCPNCSSRGRFRFAKGQSRVGQVSKCPTCGVMFRFTKPNAPGNPPQIELADDSEQGTRGGA